MVEIAHEKVNDFCLEIVSPIAVIDPGLASVRDAEAVLDGLVNAVEVVVDDPDDIGASNLGEQGIVRHGVWYPFDETTEIGDLAESKRLPI
jgi:hypothetical protein